MSNRTQDRIYAYKFIQEKLQETGHAITNTPGPFPLDDLYLLKNGQADPTEELLNALRESLRGIVPSQEFDRVLVEPFRDQS